MPKKPMRVLNAATSVVTTPSPYIVRTSQTLPQITAPLANCRAAKGLTWASRRATMAIDAAPRDIVQTIDIRRADKLGGRLQNVEFDQVADIGDPGRL